MIEYAEDAEKIYERHLVTESGAGAVLLITGTVGDIEIWLDTTGGDFDGLAIGGGVSQRQAVGDAIETLEKALRILREQV